VTVAYFLGLDVGTTGAKALLIDERGRVIATASTEYPLSTPKPLWSEQNPADWERASIESIHAVIEKSGVKADAITAVGLTGQMHGLTLLDEKGAPLRPAILWNDQRTGPQCEAITKDVGFERLLELTGNPVLPGFTAPKIAWVRENEPEVFTLVKRFLLPKDYVRYRLTGEFATEVSDASGTSLFDVKARRWSAEMFDALNIPESWAARCYESPEVTGNISLEAAEATGLVQGTVVVGGGGDQACQAIGTGLAAQGLVSATLGTSGVVFAPTNSAAIEPQGRLHAFCHGVPGMWHLMGVMLSAAGSLAWLRGVLGAEDYDEMVREAWNAPAGSEGLLFAPYLSGERTPYPDPNARGSFVGLTLRHERSHMIRSVLEGVAFGLRDSLELIREQGIVPTQIRLSGGGAKSPLWRQILADVFNVEVATVNTEEGAAYGAAILAGVGVGAWPDVPSACESAIELDERRAPEPEAVAVYEDLYPRYRELYPALKPSFDKFSS
jgi:xylulokinase